MQIIYSDNNITITDNARVLDTASIMKDGQYIDVAVLSKTNQKGLLNIVGSRTKNVVGVFNTHTNSVSYHKVDIMKTQNGFSNMSNDITGDVPWGSMSIDSLLGGNTPKQENNTNINSNINSNINFNTVQTADAPKVIEDVDYEYIEGYKFLPIPTNYTKVVMDKVSDTKVKYKIKIKADNDMTMNEKSHEDIYKDLKAKASGKDFIITEITDNELVLSSNFETFAYMLTENKGDISILPSIAVTGFYVESTKVDNLAPYKTMPYTTVLDDGNIAVTNILLSIASKSSDLFSWLDIASKELDNIQKAAIRKYIIGMLMDNVTSINNELELEDTFDPFEDPYYLRNLIDEGIDDIIVKGKYDDGFNRCYKRLTNIKNITAYNEVIISMKDDDIKSTVYKVGGITEKIPMVVCRDIDIDVELSRLIAKISKVEFYKVCDDTPNTLKLLKAILSNNITSRTGEPFNMMNYSSVGNVCMYLLVRSNLFKIVNSDEGILIRRLS